MPVKHSYSENVERNVVPRYPGDSLAADVQRRKLRAEAAIAALRSNPRAQSLVQDVDAPVEFTDAYMGDGTTGDYHLKDNKIRVALAGQTEDMENTLLHEYIHNLQNRPYELESGYYEPNAHRKNPLTVLDRGAGLGNMRMKVGKGETPEDFNQAIHNEDLYYGSWEPAAFMASNLGFGKAIRDKPVQKVFDKFPVLSTMFALQNTQPNRPMAKHFKGEPEWSMTDKILNKVFGYQPEQGIEDHARAAEGYAGYIRELRNRGGERRGR